MLIQGTCNTDNTILIAKKYTDLIANNTALNQILVITLNSYKKKNLINLINELNPNLKNENHNITTFFGLCYNAFNENWNYISKLINNEDIKNKPNLCGLEISQFILKQCIKNADFNDYISKINLIHQLFRRYSLIVQNDLSTEEIKKKSQILNESFYIDAQKAIDEYKLKTIEYKSFDYLRQLAILPLIYKNTDYFKNIKYLFIENADEFSYTFWEFIDTITPQLKDYLIAYDKEGSSRCGYLCAYKNGINHFIKKHNPTIIELKDKSILYEFAEEFYKNIKQNKKTNINAFSYHNYTKRLDMIENLINDIKKLISKGINPNDITIISPLIDDILIQVLKEEISLKIQVLSGNEKLIQTNIIKYIISIIKLSHNINLEEYELKNLLINLLNIPYNKCAEIIKEYSKNKILNKHTFKEENYNYSYRKLISVIKSLEVQNSNITEEIQTIFSNIIKMFVKDINYEKYEFLLKEAKSFEYAFGNLTQDFIIQIENSIISENPIDSFDIDKEAIILSTPQKIIDYEIKSKYQLWLDISNNEWFKQDTGTIYNAWVMNRDWEKDKYEINDNLTLTREKTARIIRKLILCCSENIIFYSSIYDNTGYENFNRLNEFIEYTNENKSEFKIIPRDDQKPVLEYKKGKLGIMAVPGAGKTTILLALIIKLIKEGVSPENIFVLTYMESAAKNFKERIKSAINEKTDTPNISTIHGLALRIIKENGNHNLIGLDENFEICDDNEKEKIIKELFYKLKIEDDNYDNYLRCISILKLSGTNLNLHSKYKEIQAFYNFYEEYKRLLKQNNLLDYDDMLCYAVQILEKNSEILKYYQNLCKYIIEDEAQDSTNIQQKLIKLLSGKYNNIVRCGDINQAITSTFTNSNLENFRKFIKENNKIEMISSQRCAEPIYNLANQLIKDSKNINETNNAFYQIEIKGTTKNPQSENNPEYINFEKETEEKTFIINEINKIIKKEPKSTIAILLRSNFQINDYNELLYNNGIKTSVRADNLGRNKIFQIVFEILKIINNPINNNHIISLAKLYKQNNLYDFNNEEINYIKELSVPFNQINPDLIENEGILQLYWDINYWLNNSIYETDILALNIGLYYSKNTIDKSNSYLISGCIKRLKTNNETEAEFLKRLEYLASKPLNIYKFFEEDLKENQENSINIMTMHKSKGDEFDYVFIPEFNEENYPVSIKNVKLKNGYHFVQTIKSLINKSEINTPDKLKEEQIKETLRLIYVGITRAKKGLYLTNSNYYKRHKNTKKINLFEKITVERKNNLY